VSALVFSVIVPTFNRPHQVAACLEALARVDYPKQAFEVILVGDGDSSDLESIVLSFRDRLALRLVRQARSGPASARNRGVDCAAGRFLAFTDDDCEPDRAWLRVLEAQLLHSPEHLIGGQTLNAAPDNPYACASHSLVDFLYARNNREGQAARFFTSNNIAMTTRMFRDVGGFHPGFPLAAAEDRELCDRWLRRGFSLTYRPDAVVRHTHRMGFRAFCKQHFRYGRGSFQYRRLARERGMAVPFEDFGFYWKLLLWPLGKSPSWKSVRCTCLVALSQLAVASGYCLQAVSAHPLAPPRAKLQLPPAG
jgi:glycosyltransferase involved in cell wall biosynthesis